MRVLGRLRRKINSSATAALRLLLVRGVLLWLVVPIAVVVWLVGGLLLFRPRGISLARFLGWVDLNLVACLQRSVLRPVFRARVSWVHPREMPNVTHRVRPLDPA